MIMALEGHMSLSYKYFAEESEIMQTGQNVSDWKAAYSEVSDSVGSEVEWRSSVGSGGDG